MVEKVLVTTALEETWPEKPEIPILFLGDWCRIYSRKELWSNLNTEVLPYHWNDREKLYRDYLYLQDFYERVLKVLAEKLNNVHNVDHGLRYWRILVGPWLYHFTCMLYDKWSSLSACTCHYNLLSTQVLNKESNNDFVPVDYALFNEWATTDEYNYYLYSNIIEELFCDDILISSINLEIKLSNKNIKTKNSLKTKLHRYAYSKLGFKKENIYCASTYMVPEEEKLLKKKFGQYPIIHQRPYYDTQTFKTNKSLRNWELELESNSLFENYCINSMSNNIPVAYLEKYCEINENALNLFPTKPNVIFTSNEYNTGELFKFWTAHNIENNSVLLIGQHGGGYGMHKFAFYEDHAYKIADKFITWGWGKGKGTNKFSPVGYFKWDKNNKYDKNNAGKLKNDIMIVISAMPRYAGSIFAGDLSCSQWERYFHELSLLIKNIDDYLHEQIIIRIFKHDYGLDQINRWKDAFPKIRIDQAEISIFEAYKSTKLFVATQNATTYLESFVHDIPSVMCWNPKYWEINNEATPYFEKLKEVKIFHDNPQSLAEHINNISNDIDEWWNNNKVKYVREEFMIKYCNNKIDSLQNIQNVINEYIKS